jgi:prepilin-type N-terminal cleavage/methylation domain-containing protein
MEPFHSPVADSIPPRGFTLVEMLVVLAIIVLLTAVVINGQGNFDKSLTITDTAYTVALSIRQAQNFGLSSRTYSGTPNAGYGVHFMGATPTTYSLFADGNKLVWAVPPYCPVGTAGTPDAKPGNCLFDTGTSETVQSFTFGRGFKITNLCGHDTGNTMRCSSTSYLTGIDMVFVRPNTNSIISGFHSGSWIQLNDASIELSAPNGGTRYICVTQAGEVSVAATACP